MSLNGVAQGAPAGNKIFMTIWDGGGTDTYDFSNYATGLSVNLNPGGWTTASASQLASLGSGRLAAGNIANALLYNNNPASLIENVLGGSAADAITANAANNVIRGNGGNDVIDGGAGSDAAAYAGNKADYSWLLLPDDTWQISDLRLNAPDGTDKLKNLEYLQFADGIVQLGAPQEPLEPPVVPSEPPDNTAPVAIGDSYATARNTKLVVQAVSGVLKNDTDADGDALAAMLVTRPSRGTLVFRADGSFDYTPARNFTGTVSFTYRAGDGEDPSNLATVVITVGASSSVFRRGADVARSTDELHQAPAPAGDNGDLLAWLAQTTAGRGWSGSALADHLGDGNGAVGFHAPGCAGEDIGIAGLPSDLRPLAPDFIFSS
jgi:hypothetical protein